MKTRVLQEVLAYDFGSNYLVSDVLGYDYQSRRDDDGDRLSAPLRSLECRKLEYACSADSREVYESEQKSQNVSCDDRDQDGDGACESSVQNAAEDGETESHEEYDEDLRIKVGDHLSVVSEDAGCLSSRSRELKTDERYDRSHCRRRQDRVDPLCAYEFDEYSYTAHQKTCHNEAAERISVAESRLGDHQQGRRDEREGGSEISRSLALCDKNKDKRSYAVHEEGDGRAYP